MDRPEDRVALIEVLDPHGRALRWLDVAQWPLTIGRALDNQLVLDDPHVAAHHLRLEPDAEGRLAMTVLDTGNGVELGRTRLQAGAQAAVAPGGAFIQLGTVRLRLRLPGETLAAERLLPAGRPAAALAILGIAAALMLLALLDHWLSLDPGADATAWLPVLVGLPVVLAAWCGLWALMSKLFQHRFDIAGHLRIVLPWLLAIELVDLVVPQLAAALGWAALWHLATPAQAVLLALMVRAHLAHLLPPQFGRAVGIGVLAMALAGGAISLAFTQRKNDRFARAPYMSTLPLPAFNATTPHPPAALVQQLAPLAERIAERVRKARDDEAEDGADSD